ncbi:MAG: ATP cone domain-containing protein [Phycisphaerae bacterium]|nr:ATP cone domain-containing protein [Phycisphaerae bacterium]
MNGSRTIRVAKRDGTFEPFDRAKLASAIYKAMRGGREVFSEAGELALAIDIYLHQRGWGTVSSAAVFEMVLKTFRQIGMDLPAAVMDTHHTWRVRKRRNMKIRYPDGLTALWDKGWLVKLICSSWHLSRSTGRLLAGDIETKLLDADTVGLIGRNDLIEQVNSLVAAYGLADAVPVESHSLET